MKFQIADIALVLSITCLSSAAAFAPSSLVRQQSAGAAFITNQIAVAKTTTTSSSSSKLFSQWDEDEEDSSVARASFEEATKAATDEDDQKELEEMGDFDATSTYDVDDISKYRDAIKKRAASIGLEKRSAEDIAADQAAAMQKAIESGEGLVGAAARKNPDQLSDMLDESQVQQLDLSKISNDAPRGQNEEDVPAMLYDPTKDMTKEEMEEADPTGLKPWNEQIAWVLDKAEFPTPLSVLGETIVTVVTVVVTAVIFTQWDEICRQTAFNYKFVPRPEDVQKALEGMLLPGDTVLGMGAQSMSGQEMLQMLQDGTKETIKAVQDGSIKDILAGDVPTDL